MPKCRQIENCPDCFARKNDGECLALANTEFGFKACPFYKTKQKQRDELDQLRKRGLRNE